MARAQVQHLMVGLLACMIVVALVAEKAVGTSLPPVQANVLTSEDVANDAGEMELPMGQQFAQELIVLGH